MFGIERWSEPDRTDIRLWHRIKFNSFTPYYIRGSVPRSGFRRLSEPKCVVVDGREFPGWGSQFDVEQAVLIAPSAVFATRERGLIRKSFLRASSRL